MNEHEKRAAYLEFALGFGHGASHHGITSDSHAYMDGYQTGQHAQRAAVDQYCLGISYTPTVLHTMGKKDGQ
jgi:hypothetical protein